MGKIDGALLRQMFQEAFLTTDSSNREIKRDITLEKGLRYNKDKRKWSYVHFKSLEPMIEVLEFGAKKYAPFNWQKGLDLKEILESMQRHLAALMDGEEIDPESGISHVGHIQCNAMFYNYHKQLNSNNNEKD